jgi:hypothetical protein
MYRIEMAGVIVLIIVPGRWVQFVSAWGPLVAVTIRLLASSMVYYGHAWSDFMGQYDEQRCSILLIEDGTKAVN